MPAALADLTLVLQRAANWRVTYALPTISQVAASGKPPPGPSVNQGKADFDQIRDAMADLQANLAAQRNRPPGRCTTRPRCCRRPSS